jgi:hypothetical protein
VCVVCVCCHLCACDTYMHVCAQAERQLAELGFEYDGMADSLDEANGITSQTIEISRRREAELAKVKKDFELLTVQFESLEASLRKRHQEAMRDL